jgi:aryl-alcohol dehydrogenase-like predicted oxidoreductase
MEYQRLGQTELEISRVGFGCWTMGGSRWGKVDDRDSIAAVHQALDLGVNFFDTADVYGFGHSEEILSQALGSRRHQVVIATKFGVSWDKEGNTSRDCSPKRLVAALEGSLRRLKLDCIPLYQIHWPDWKTPIGAVMEALKECQRAGKIRYIGCANFSPDIIREAQKTARLESLQMPYNILERDIEEEVLPFCRDEEIAVLAYQPLAHGLLSGKYAYGARFGEDDFRSGDRNFQGETFKRNLKLVERLKQVAARHGKSPGQVAIRWILDNPAVTSAITGIRNPEQIAENVGAMDWRLSAEDSETISGR